MYATSREVWEQAEVERSAFEAAQKIDQIDLVLDETQIRRYLAPPADTHFALEYSFHLLGDVVGKTVLEYGCGDGVNTVVLARRGAKVKSLDISRDLIDIARQRLEANQVEGDVEFIVGSAHDVPLEDESVDVVFGLAILHHLDLEASAKEVFRLLRPGGRAIFQEPVRNSRVLRLIRGMIPYQAPDVSPFERPLTDTELAKYGKAFRSFQSKGFVLPTTNLIKLLPVTKRYGSAMTKLDGRVLKKFPSLLSYATVRVIELVK